MVKFEPRDPFPLLPLESFTKTEAHSHSAEADRWLGLRVEHIEEQLRLNGSRQAAPSSSGEKQQLWFGLEPRDLQTPFFEIRALLEKVCVGPSFVVDLGAAYARMAFVIERHFPLVRFQGVEYVGERVQEARKALSRNGATRSVVDHADLTSPSFVLPQADVYFLYDYGTPAAIEKTLYDLRKRAKIAPITIVARGRVCRYAIESRHSLWLKRADPSAPERAVTIYESKLGAERIETPTQNCVV